MIFVIIQLIIYYYKLGLKMITHPGTYFAIIWCFSMFSQSILMQFDIALIKDIDSIEELNIFVKFTSIFFTFWTLLESPTRDSGKDFIVSINYQYLKVLMIIMLIGSLLLMVFTWYSIGVRSLNIGHIRDLNTRDKSNYLGSKSNIFLSILKYTQFFYPILAILCGYFLGRIFLQKKRVILTLKYILLPLVVAFIYMLTTGGRNPIFMGIKYYLQGICFSLPFVLHNEQKKWLLKRILVVVLFLPILSTYISDSRSTYKGVDSYSNNFDNPILAAISGGIEYAGAHYYGYQLRNVDTYDDKNLGFGFYTFNSFFEIKLPFSNYFGIKDNLGSLLGFKDNAIDYFYLWNNDFEGYYTTNSTYLGLKLDFGFIGTLLFLLLYTYYTNYLFNKIWARRDLTLYTMFWFSLCFEFWASSNFESSYANGLVGGIIMIYLFSKFFSFTSRNTKY